MLCSQIMQLTNLLQKLKNSPPPPEHFFAIEISEDSVKTASWTVTDSRTQVVKLGSSKSWDGLDQKNLLLAVDQSLSAASENLTPEPNGAIFGLPDSWLDQGNILPEKKEFLKHICQELDLKPLGFVVTDTALIKYLKIEEGTPVSAIFLQLNTSEVNVTLVKLGKIIGSQLVGRSEDLGQDVEEGLSRFQNLDTLPSRMILFDGQKDFEEDKQQLMSYDWEEKLPFIHFPKVESLTPEITIKAIALAGGSEVAKSLGFTIKAPVKPNPSPEAAAEPEPEPTVIESEPSAESLGFVVNQDIAETETLAEPEPVSAIDSEPEPEFEPEPKPSKLNLVFLSTIKNRLVQLIKQVKIPTRRPKSLLAWLAIGFVAILLLLFAVYWYTPKAKVVIVVEPRSIDQDFSLTIDTKASSLDVGAFIIPGEPVDISVSGTASQPTTGTKLIGDPAEGDVTIYNKTSQTKSFAAGTTLIGPGNLSFVLDDDTTVASSSSKPKEDGTGEEVVYGQAQASVTAKSIGPEGNLAGNANLNFQQFSDDDYYARVSSGLSGGTAREVRAVSEADQTQLLTSLTDQLTQQAAGEIETKLGTGNRLVDVDDKSKTITKTYNHQVGEETDTLTLEAKLEYASLSYKESDLNSLLQQAIAGKIPDNFQLAATNDTSIKPAVLNSDSTAKVDVVFKANLIPKLDFPAIKDKLKGRQTSAVQEYLASLPSFIRADITVKSIFSGKLKTLPRVAKNISLEVKIQQP